MEFDLLNPPVPGLYKIRAEAKLSGETSAPPERTAVANLLLPYAGPGIAVRTDGQRSWLIEEARQIVQTGGVGDQWRQHVDDLATIWQIDTPFGTIDIDDPSFRHRAVLTAAGYMFDYIGIATFNDPSLPPSRRYNFADVQRRPTDTNNDGEPWNDPSYATFNGRVIPRTVANAILATVWLRTQGYSVDHVLVFSSLNNISQRGSIDSSSTRSAIKLGDQLYLGIVIGLSDEEIMEVVFTDERARDIQTADVLNDLNLWPRPDVVQDRNTSAWTGNTNLSDGKSFTRPTIFFQSADDVVARDPRNRQPTAPVE